MASIIDLVGTMRDIISNKIKNPHNVTAKQLNGMTKEEIDALLATKASAAELGITSYGDSSYLPVNVVGSFEGAGITNGNTVALEESDGTIVFLRAGIDGRRQGVYYSTAKFNPVTNEYDIVNTAIRYEPSFLPPGAVIYRVSKCLMDTNQIFGYVRKADNTICGFIADTRGTMDQSFHTGFLFETSEPSESGSVAQFYEDAGVIYRITLFMAFNVEVRFATMLKSNPVGQFTPIIGWTGTGMNGAQYTNDAAMRLTPSLNGTNPNSYLIVNPNFNTMVAFQTRQHMEVYLNNNEVTIIFGHEAWANSITKGDARVLVVRKITGNLFNKTYALDPACNQSLTLVDTGPSAEIRSNAVMSQSRFNGLYMGNYAGNICKQGDLLFASTIGNGGDLHISIAKSNQDLKNLATRDWGAVSKRYRIVTQAGSNMYGYLHSLNVLDANHALVYSIVKDSAGNLTNSLVKIDTNGWNPSQDFTAFDGTKYKTFPLTLNREPATDLLKFPSETVVEINGNNVYRTTCIFHRDNLVGHTNYDLKDGVLPGAAQVSMTQAQLDKIQSDLVALLTASGLTVVRSDGFLQVVVPQYTSMKPFAIYIALYDTNRLAYIRKQLDFSIKIGALPTPTYGSHLITSDFYGTSNKVVEYQRSAVYPAITIGEYAGFTLQTGSGPVNVAVVGNSAAINYTIKEKAGVSTLLLNAGINPHPSAGYIQVPNLGYICTGDVSTYNNSKYTVFPGYVIGKDEAAIDGKVRTPGYLFATIAVPVGYVVYFTERVPVNLFGKKGLTEPSNVDLASIADPVTTGTFYVYVTYDSTDGKFKHRVFATPQSVNNDMLYVGYIKTNATGIAEIKVTKQVGLLGYTISPTKRGSAIPVTTGFPTEEGTLNWK